ncbi:hypothetical protein QQS21_000813 [Conoideocrella luteorostrata]|uniref:Secretory lipase n=1 Tax=Conoideocrella luteorostrata TaxID=1105319 RepID=A0AAJ0D0G5_9HYPO|nr:hypothetical protein QQS21_000813 [Conoideocrella luteorostrata]
MRSRYCHYLLLAAQIFSSAAALSIPALPLPVLPIPASSIPALSIHVQRSNSSAVPPSQDPFYAVPSDLGNKSPGAILNHRQSPSPVVAFGINPDNIQDSHQVLYRTTDGNGQATATVMTLLIPKNANLGAVLSFQLAENAIIIDCAPSYGITAAGYADKLLSSPTAQLQVLLIQAALADGWVVAVPDFQGPKAAFVDQKMAGQAILDALRATLQSGSFTGVRQDALTALWGYSAGASVTKVAAEFQPKYAKELNLAGVAFGGTGSAGLGIIKEINNGPHAGLIPPSLIGLALESPEFKLMMDLNLKKEFKDKFYSPLHQCLDANLKTFENADVLGMFVCWDFCVFPALNVALLKYVQGSGVSKAPVYWYQDVHDEIAPIKDVDAAVQKYCDSGANVHYQRDDAANVNHKNYGIIGAPNALGWLRDIMHGKKPDPQCVTETVTISDLPDSFLNIFPPVIRNGLVQLLHQTS